MASNEIELSTNADSAFAKQTPLYTCKQMGDACEMLVAAELTLAGVPALKVPDNWPGYDVIAQPPDRPLQRVSVKSRTFKPGAAYVEYNVHDDFDWIAIVLLPGNGVQQRQIYLVPRYRADESASKNGPDTKYPNQRYWSIQSVPKIFAAFLSNFALRIDDAVSNP